MKEGTRTSLAICTGFGGEHSTAGVRDGKHPPRLVLLLLTGPTPQLRYSTPFHSLTGGETWGVMPAIATQPPTQRVPPSPRCTPLHTAPQHQHHGARTPSPQGRANRTLYPHGAIPRTPSPHGPTSPSPFTSLRPLNRFTSPSRCPLNPFSSHGSNPAAPLPSRSAHPAPAIAPQARARGRPTAAPFPPPRAAAPNAALRLARHTATAARQ